MALAAVSAVLYALWSRGAFLPGWVRWEEGVFLDAAGEYEIRLERRKVRVSFAGEEVWVSPEGVKVQQALSADIDNDGQEELVLLCWKRGRYGVHRPFWVEKDERTWSQHLFVYEYEGSLIRPKWMSSYMGVDAAGLCWNGKEPPWGSLLITDSRGEVSSWRWDSWGFAREDISVSFAVFGDNLIHEPIYRYGLREDGEFDFLFDNMRETIEKYDVAVINQETPLTDDSALYGDYPRFGTPVNVGQAIADAGFAVVTCATNHCLDRGAEGIDFTKSFFASQGVLCLGIQRKAEKDYTPCEIVRRNNIRFALFNYTYGTNGIPVPEENPYMVHLLEDEERVREDIGRAKEEADFVILFVHWGTENVGQPDAFQKKWSQIFLEAGADVVVGTHPHTLQSWEMLEGEDGREMLVYYSIGNYISAQSEKSCVKGGMAEFTVSLTQDGYQITEYGLRPLVITWQEGGKYSVDFQDP